MTAAFTHARVFYTVNPKQSRREDTRDLVRSRRGLDETQIFGWDDDAFVVIPRDQARNTFTSIAKRGLAIKDNVTDLALFGGQPAFAEPLHVGRPNIGNRRKLAERVSDVFGSRWLTNGGRYVDEFEKRIAEYVGVEHCIAMCNATIALEVAIRAANLSVEVIVPSFTFIATAHALLWQGITPIFCDIDLHTHNLDPESLEQKITNRTSGIIGVHLWGRPCNIEASCCSTLHTLLVVPTRAR